MNEQISGKKAESTKDSFACGYDVCSEHDAIASLHQDINSKLDSIIAEQRALNLQTSEILKELTEYKNRKLELKNGQTLELTRDEAIAHTWNKLNDLTESMIPIKKITSSTGSVLEFIKNNKVVVLIVIGLLGATIINLVALLNSPASALVNQFVP
jgi:hypothetical protein